MIVFAKADGSVINVMPSPVYQGSNLSGSIYFVAPLSRLNAVNLAFKLPNGIYTQSYNMTGVSELEGITDKLGKEYSVWEWEDKNAEITQYAGVCIAQFSAYLPNGQLLTTSSASFEVQEGVLPELPPVPSQDVYESIKRYLALLDDRTKNVPYLVADIKKVAGNAFTYTDNSGVESAPIVLTGGADVPIPVNAASTIKVPKEAFAAVEGGYSYTVTAEIHGQMRDGAAARDLWVSFDEAEEAAFKGAYEDYTVNEAGDITITVTTPVDLTVRVWNGKGLVDEVARADIAAETERAEAEENRLQEQITELRNTGVDVVARADIAVLKEDLAAEVERAENAEGVLASDIQGLREDITNEAHFRGYLETNAEIEALSGTPNDYAYSAESGTVWIYQTETGWTDSGRTVPDQFTPASTSVPLMDGMGSAGVAEEYARGDHRHPSDTSKLDKSGGTMTGLLKLANDGLRSGNEEYGVQVDRYLNFHALNNANAWSVFNQQNELVLNVDYKKKQVEAYGPLLENGQRVYSPNNPPPSGATTNIINLTEISGTLSEEQSATVIDNPSNVLFYYQDNFYALSAKKGNSYNYSTTNNQNKKLTVSTIKMTYSTSTALITLNGVYTREQIFAPKLSFNAEFVRHITMKNKQYFTLYVVPYSDFIKGANISTTVGKKTPNGPTPYNGTYYTTLANSTDDSSSHNLHRSYQPWRYYDYGNNHTPLPDNRIGDATDKFTPESAYPNNMGYMAIAQSEKPWTLRIGGYTINAPGVDNTSSIIRAQRLNYVPTEQEPNGQWQPTAIMFTAVGAVQNATISVTVLDGPNKAGWDTLTVTYTFNVTIE